MHTAGQKRPPAFWFRTGATSPQFIGRKLCLNGFQGTFLIPVEGVRQVHHVRVLSTLLYEVSSCMFLLLLSSRIAGTRPQKAISALSKPCKQASLRHELLRKLLRLQIRKGPRDVVRHTPRTEHLCRVPVLRIDRCALRELLHILTIPGPYLLSRVLWCIDLPIRLGPIFEA